VAVLPAVRDPVSIASTSRHPGGFAGPPRRGPAGIPPAYFARLQTLGIRISHAGLRVFIPSSLTLNLNDCPNEFGRCPRWRT